MLNVVSFVKIKNEPSFNFGGQRLSYYAEATADKFFYAKVTENKC